jgi:hypothetical protein
MDVDVFYIWEEEEEEEEEEERSPICYEIRDY